LIRRAYFDLIGLPPSPQEAADFIADRSPDAWSRIVDRLLANPHYGERWGRYWLDLARYGEDQAHSFEPRLYPQGFRYRDWVTNALNADMPYDQFVKEQIAADLLNEPDKENRIAALGFFALGPVYYGDGKMFDQYDDRVDTLSRSVLALTVACARCHDHKFDPISQKDYYGLAGVFASSNYIESPVTEANAETKDGKPAAADGIVNRNDAINKKAAELEKFVTEQQSQFRSRFSPEISRYVQAAWKLRNRRKADPKLTIEQFAATEKLDPVVLERWAQYLEKPAEGDHEQPHLAAWRSLIKAEDPKTDLSANEKSIADVRKIADDLQAKIQGMTSRRIASAEQKANKAGGDRPVPLDKTENAVLDEITGNDGVLTVPQDKLNSLLNGDPRLRFGILTAELSRLKMGAFVHALTDAAKPTNLPVLARGNPEAPGKEEPRHFLSLLCADANPAPFKQGSGRLELANAITDRSNPLTARVIVNRVWQHHFGVGLVRTASNFGMLGDPPSNPDLLDYLTSQFIKGGWSLKSLHRQIMLSAAYQMTSASDPHRLEIDPDNRLVWRMPRRRLEVEAWRDSMLAVSGALDLKIGGPSLQLASADNHRRTYYAAVSRHDLDAMLRLFDFPDPNATIDTRMTTTVPLQQLFVLNSEYMARQARAFAARLNSIPGCSDADRVRQAFALAFNRTPSAVELALALNFLSGPKPYGPEPSASTQSAPAQKKPEPLTRWEQYAQVLLSSNEFMYVD
jgi:cytochrome c553